MGPVEIPDRDRPFFLNRRKRVLLYFGPATVLRLARMQRSQKKITEDRIGATDVVGVLNLQMVKRRDCSWPSATRNWR